MKGTSRRYVDFFLIFQSSRLSPPRTHLVGTRAHTSVGGGGSRHRAHPLLTGATSGRRFLASPLISRVVEGARGRAGGAGRRDPASMCADRAVAQGDGGGGCATMMTTATRGAPSPRC